MQVKCGLAYYRCGKLLSISSESLIAATRPQDIANIKQPRIPCNKEIETTKKTEYDQQIIAKKSPMAIPNRKRLINCKLIILVAKPIYNSIVSEKILRDRF